jgi:hypothetical protein
MTMTTTNPAQWDERDERTVFLDNTGRRARWMQAGGAHIAFLTACWCAALVAGSIGFGAMPSLATATARRPAAVAPHSLAALNRHRQAEHPRRA